MKSMTGYGSETFDTDIAHYKVEFRTYNARYLDVNIKVPRNYNLFEVRIKKLIAQRFTRGRIDLLLTVDPIKDQNLDLEVNRSLLQAYHSHLKEIRKEYKLIGEISLDHLVGLDQVFNLRSKEADLDKEWSAFEVAAAKAMESVEAMRTQEGQFLQKEILEQVEMIAGHLKKIQAEHQKGLSALQERFKERIAELTENLPQLDSWKLEQESLYFINRSDINEECTRIASHLKQIEGLPSDTNPVGRRMEFILQELFREFNTIGSKSQSAEVSQEVIEAKTILEKLREQSQNIE